MSALRPLALVINPAATRAGTSLRAEVARALAPHGLEWSLVTRGTGDAGRLARLAAEEGAVAVVTLGGDGTASEAAGALAGGPVAMAPLPGGNSNVFARAIGWPASPRGALPQLIDALAAGRVRDASLGLVRTGDGERVFAINAGMGLDAATVEWIEARPRTKRRLGEAGFVIGVTLALARAGGAPRLHARADGGEEVEAWAVLAACGTPYAYLGRRPLDLVPGAAFDGRLAWLALTRVRVPEVSRLLLRALRGRDLPLGGSALTGGALQRGLTVRAEDPAAVQADGEPLGRHGEIAIAPGPVLRTVVPRASPVLKSEVGPPN